MAMVMISILLKCTTYKKQLSKFLREALLGEGVEGICMCFHFIHTPLSPLTDNALHFVN